MRVLTIVGTNHFTSDYKWVFGIIAQARPDCITLEQQIDGAASLYWDFKRPLQESMKTHAEQKMLCDEYSAGIIYSRVHGTPIYFIDEYEPFSRAINTNMIERNNFEMLYLSGWPSEKERKEGEFDNEASRFVNYTRRNGYMGIGINHQFLVNGYENVVHIGGAAHLNDQECIPLQSLIIADVILIADAINQTIHRYK